MNGLAAKVASEDVLASGRHLLSPRISIAGRCTEGCLVLSVRVYELHVVDDLLEAGVLASQ